MRISKKQKTPKFVFSNSNFKDLEAYFSDAVRLIPIYTYLDLEIGYLQIIIKI